MSANNEIINDIISSSGEKKSASLGYLNHLLKENILNPDELIPLIVRDAVHYYDFVALVICFRNGGNPNLYVNTSGLGPAHLLVYGYDKIKDKFLFHLFYTLSVLLGSSTMSPSFYKNVKKDTIIMDYDLVNGYRKTEEIIEIVPEKVSEWLYTHDIQYPLISSDIYESLSGRDDMLTQLVSVYLNQPQLYNWTINLFPDFLISRNPNWKSLFTFNDEERYLLTPINQYLIEGMRACFSDGVASIIEYLPSYFDFTFWISTYRSVQNGKNLYLIKECEKIFKMAISSGYQLDLYQMDEIGSIDMSFRIAIFNTYRKPLWHKVCSTDSVIGKIPSSLAKISLYLGIPSNTPYSDVCDKLLQITSADFESLRKAIKKRQKMAISSALDPIQDFINPRQTDTTCYNQSNFEHDPLMYSDYSLAYYRDNKNNTWCYLSNSFESILADPVNKSTGEPFPQEFLLLIEEKCKVAKFFNLPLSEPQNLEKIVALLKRDDEITNIETDFIISSVIQIANLNNITRDDMINNITFNEYERRFRNVGYKNLHEIIPIPTDMDLTLATTTTHLSVNIQLSTICRFLYFLMKSDLQNGVRFFEILR